MLAGLAIALLLFALVRALDETPAVKPWLKVLGASFIFNYRVADVYAGFTAVPQRAIPIGSVLRAEFENPAGGDPFVVTEQIGLADRQISMRSPPMRGVRADVDYRLTLSLLDRVSGEPFWQTHVLLRSNIGDEVVPEQPLTIGPGYRRRTDQ